ncbi:hypothetical protein AYI68_g7846 [Smittium mucronatum]|uniref:Uncharacterized protein n=1 Tax=Smittium mucronatum TaxID=133383 RepID=A0A1R0GMK4_9FUNG|nr:hypothetical protein AYI68_g7846 [Smittium mucronatum]
MKSNGKPFEIVLNPLNAFDVQQTRDNQILFECLRERKNILSGKYTKLVDGWIRTIMRFYDFNVDVEGKILNTAVSIKATIDKNVEKYLKFAGDQQNLENFDSDEDSDFEQVDIDETLQSIEGDFLDFGLVKNLDPDDYFKNTLLEDEERDTSKKKPIVGQELPKFDEFYSPSHKKHILTKDYGTEIDYGGIDMAERPKPLKWSDIEKQNESFAADFNINITSKKPDTKILEASQNSGLKVEEAKKKKSKTKVETGKPKATQYSRLSNIMKKGKRKY